MCIYICTYVYTLGKNRIGSHGKLIVAKYKLFLHS